MAPARRISRQASMATQPAPSPLWTPSAELIEGSRLTEFMGWLKAERGLEFADYDALWQWSVDDLDGFWGALWDFFGVQADGDRSTVLASREMPGARWFPDVSLNYAEHVFAGKDDGETAILHASAVRELDELSWGELRAQGAACAAALRGLGALPTWPHSSGWGYIPEGIGALIL